MPATRADIFSAEGLTLPQRRALMRFLTAAQAAMQGEGPLKVRLVLVKSLVASVMYASAAAAGTDALPDGGAAAMQGGVPLKVVSHNLTARKPCSQPSDSVCTFESESESTAIHQGSHKTSAQGFSLSIVI